MKSSNCSLITISDDDVVESQLCVDPISVAEAEVWFTSECAMFIKPSKNDIGSILELNPQRWAAWEVDVKEHWPFPANIT